MPDSDSILAGLTALANEWKMVAIAWHAVIAAFAIALGLGASSRTTEVVAGLLLLSVSVLASLGGNPFNAAAFGALVVVALFSAVHANRYHGVSTRRFQAVGWLLVAFGLLYPEFVSVRSWAGYVYAAPVGVVPCPTLAVITGFALIQGGLSSTGATLVIALADLFYGVVGVLLLRVPIDAALVAGGVAMFATTLVTTRAHGQVGAHSSGFISSRARTSRSTDATQSTHRVLSARPR
jgi:hypothetical protein